MHQLLRLGYKVGAGKEKIRQEADQFLIIPTTKFRSRLKSRVYRACSVKWPQLPGLQKCVDGC